MEHSDLVAAVHESWAREESAGPKPMNEWARSIVQTWQRDDWVERCWASVTLAVEQYAVCAAALWLTKGHAVERGLLTFFAVL